MSAMRSLFEDSEDDLKMADETTPTTDETAATQDQGAPTKKPAKKKAAKSSTSPKKGATPKAAKTAKATDVKRTRTIRPYPMVAFKDATQIGDAIFRVASGEKVRRLTLLEAMDRIPTSSATKQLITNSGKYGITTGSYSADFLELTATGKTACNPSSPSRDRIQAQFKLAIEDIPPFKLLYETYKSKKLPTHEVMKDVLVDSELYVENPKECIDLFVVNVQFLGLLRSIAGAETLIPIEQRLEGLGKEPLKQEIQSTPQAATNPTVAKHASSKWDSVCFYITAIGDEDSAPRKHSDLFLSYLVEPALKDLSLDVVRSDQIAEPGMITTKILEHIKKCKLVVADLSWLNPNVFYEVALRHSLRLPIVQIIQKSDKLPFDVNQVNSLVIDNSDIYSLIPKLETYRSQITTLCRGALDDPEHIGNPITVFFPDFWK